MTNRQEPKENEFTKEYKKFWAAANELGEQDIEQHPLQRRESKRDRVERHLLGMLEMYQIRMGNPEERLLIVNFLEKQLFGIPPVEEETSHLTYDMWKDLRETILSGGHREFNLEAKSE